MMRPSLRIRHIFDLETCTLDNGQAVARKICSSSRQCIALAIYRLHSEKPEQHTKPSASSSTTLLTLLLTAGALIGAPAKKLWVSYKLYPIAGFFSSALALGGSIIPHQVSEYAK